MTIENVLKLRSLHIMCGSPKKMFERDRVFISCVDPERKCFKVGESIYLVWITTAMVLKLRKLYILCGSPQQRF